MRANTYRSSVGVIAVFCLAQTCAQLGAFTFPALLPTFLTEWRITHSEGGWLSGIFFGAYAVSVPLLVTLTDRVPARHVYAWSVSLTTVSHLGMATLAQGFWSALAMRILAGTGWAGTYMVGLRALTDEVDGSLKSRAVALHAASIGVSGASSFAIAGGMSALAGWRSAFLVSALGSLVALVVSVGLFPRRPADGGTGRLLDFGPVIRNRDSIAYSLGYCAHTWEMFSVRSWAVTFLTFSAGRGGLAPVLFVPTVIATLMELFGTATSVLGNEMALRVGRRRFILLVMTASIAMSLVTGFTSAWGYTAAVIACLVYNAVIYADSASLTAGTVESALPGKRGATLAVHATLGYGGGFLGPLVTGVTLDAMNGESIGAWGVGFGHVAVVMLVGFAALRRVRREA